MSARSDERKKLFSKPGEGAAPLEPTEPEKDVCTLYEEMAKAAADAPAEEELEIAAAVGTPGPAYSS